MEVFVKFRKKNFSIIAVMSCIYLVGFYKRMGLFRPSDFLFTIGIGFLLVGAAEFVMDSCFLAPVTYGMKKFADIFMNRLGKNGEKMPGRFADYFLQRRKDRNVRPSLYMGVIFLILSMAAAFL